MPSFLNKTFASYFKRIFQVDQSTNTGVDGTLRALQSGDGTNSSVLLSTNNLAVSPQTADSTTALKVSNNAGNNILAVDTTNSLVKVGVRQVSATTQYQNFGLAWLDTAGSAFTADTHHAIAVGGSHYGGLVDENYAMGSSTSSSFNDTNPATSLTIADTAFSIIRTYWFVMDDITIDAVKWWHAADEATGDSTAAHLMSYTVDKDNASTSGDLSSGTVLADGATITNAGYEQAYFQNMTIQSADVDAGKVIIFTFASDTVNSDYTINATVKFHIR